MPKANRVVAALLSSGMMAASGCGGTANGECTGSLSPPPEARSCEVLLVGEGDTITDIVFSDSVLGESVQQQPNVALAWHALSDAPMGSESVRVTSRGGGYVVEVARCFDRDGRELDARLGEGGGCHD